MGGILIACEESQVVTIEMRKLGLEAYSCDILPCSGGFPEWHIREDVGQLSTYPWDLVVAFPPPCTHLAVSGAAHFERKRKEGLQKSAIEFFLSFLEFNTPRLAIENPVSIMSTLWRRPDQYIQPWQFGHGETKKTCLWLDNLPPLIPTNIVAGREQRIHNMPRTKDRGFLRSKTYLGIAKAIAHQWGPLTLKV